MIVTKYKRIRFEGDVLGTCKVKNDKEYARSGFVIGTISLRR
jgi:hypothetical protein